MSELLTQEKLIEGAQANPGRVVVVSAENQEALHAVSMAMDDGVIKGGFLIGETEAIKEVANKVNLSLNNFEIIHEPDYAAAAAKAVELIKDEKGDFLLKGQVDTKLYLKAILNKEMGLLPEGNTLSHTAILYMPTYHKLLLSTDAAILIEPGVEEKVKMVSNAIDTARQLGIKKPKVAMIAAVEKINPKMRSTIEADAVVQKHKNEKRFGDAFVEGPYDIYIATSKEAAETKKVSGEVCGDADILAFSDINVANVFYKSISRFVKDSWAAGVISGARVPILLPSRADDALSKRMSIAVAAYMMAK